MSEKQAIARNVADSLGLTSSIKTILIEEVNSPWSERAFIKRKKGHIEAKLILWRDTPFLYGRIYRLFLYIHDVVNPRFQYDAKEAPREEDDPRIRERYNQIWSLYVDSRVEKLGIENFFNRTVRQNLFVDAEKDLPWEETKAIFGRLWNKEEYTHPDIVDYTFNFDRLRERSVTDTPEAFEVAVNRLLREPFVKTHMERIHSKAFSHTANELLNFTAYQCKDMQIDVSYFGISFLFQRRIFVELIPTDENTILLTIYNPDTRKHETHIISENSDIDEIQKLIKTYYAKATIHSQQR